VITLAQSPRLDAPPTRRILEIAFKGGGIAGAGSQYDLAVFDLDSDARHCVRFPGPSGYYFAGSLNHRRC